MKRNKTRELLAQEAARIMSQEAVRDYLAAKRKAAARLGVDEAAGMPSNAEVEREFLRYQGLFDNGERREDVRRLREIALEVMRRLVDFSPRLFGSVFEGTADRHSNVNILLFAEPVEEVAFFLLDRRIRYRDATRRLMLQGEAAADYPAYTLQVEHAEIELTVLSPHQARQPLRSHTDGRVLGRADIPQLEQLLRADPPSAGDPFEELLSEFNGRMQC